MTRCVLVLVSHPSQLQSILSYLRTLDGSVDTVVVSVSPDIDPMIFRPYAVRFHPLRYYIDNNPSTLDQLAHEVIAVNERLLRQWENYDKVETYHGVLVWACFLPDFAHRYIQPIIQGILGFHRMIQLEKPSEIWISEVSRWTYFAPILEGSGPRWLEYSVLYPKLMAQVASKFDVPVRRLKPSVQEVALYGMSRYIRPLVFQVYKFWHWWHKSSPGKDKTLANSGGSSPTVAFLIRSRVGAERLLPVVETLRNLRSVVFSDLPLNMHASLGLLGSRGLTFAGRRVYLSSLADAMKLKRAAKQWLNSLISRNWAYLDTDFSDLLRAALRACICEFDETVTYINATERAINRYNPQVWIVANDQSIAGRSVISTCHMYNISTIMVQHGLITDPPIKRPIVSKFAAMGQRAMEVLANWGVPTERIIVTGMPRYARQEKRSGMLPDVAKNLNSNYDPVRPTVTILAGPLAERLSFVARSIEIANDLNVNVVLKIHPLDDAEYYTRKLVQLGCENLFSVVEDVAIHDILAVTDVLVSYESTVVMEAMSLEIPVIILEANVRYNVIEKSAYAGHLKVARNNEPLSPLVAELLFNKAERERYIQQQRALARYLIQNNDDATERIVSIVNNLSTRRRSKRE